MTKRTLIAAATLVAASLSASIPALAMPRGNGLPVVNTQSVQLIGQRHIRRNRNRHYRRGNYGRGGYRYGRYNNGAAVVSGIIGLGVGLAIANSYRRDAYYDDRYYGDGAGYGYQSGSPEWIAACSRKYRSFEPYSGLYTTYAGYKQRCRLP
jgi:hypothetical protein